MQKKTLDPDTFERVTLWCAVGALACLLGFFTLDLVPAGLSGLAKFRALFLTTTFAFCFLTGWSFVLNFIFCNGRPD